MTYPDAPAFSEISIHHWKAQEKGDDGKPYETENVVPRWHGGLTKREYFAALAMQGLLAADVAGEHSADAISALATTNADALIIALNTKAAEPF